MVEKPTEPQVAFTRHSDQLFNEFLRYGQMPKAEMLIRLGVKGPWQHYAPKVREQAMRRPSRFFDTIPSVGYVYRLPCTDDTRVELHARARAKARVTGVAALIRQLETET